MEPGDATCDARYGGRWEGKTPTRRGGGGDEGGRANDFGGNGGDGGDGGDGDDPTPRTFYVSAVLK